jgi:general stress protein 26
MPEKRDSMEAATAKKPGNPEELWNLVDGIETAMLTTRRADGRLVSRPMATQARSAGADFWFVTADGMPKLAEIERDPRVNLAYYRDRTKEWVSVSGNASISRDRAKIRELYRPDWKAWFPEGGGAKGGTPDDPRMVLIGVRALSAQYMTVDKPQPVVLFEIVRGMVTGKMPKMGEVKTLRGAAGRLARPGAAPASRRRARGASRRRPSRA